MKKSNTQSLGNVIFEYLRSMGLETPLYEHRVMNAWPEVIGEAMSKYTGELRIFNQVLYVKVSSAAVRNELMMRRSELVTRLNAVAGAQTITAIVLR